MRRLLPFVVLVAVVAVAALAARVVLGTLDRPPSTLDQKLAAADRFLYYVVGERGGPRFELSGSERTLRLVSHAVLAGVEFDPYRNIVYGLRVRVDLPGEPWVRDVWVRSRQSKAGWDGRAWLEEAAFSTDPELQVTDDRTVSVRLPEAVPAGALLEISLLTRDGSPVRQGLVRVYQQLERPRSRAAQTLRSLSPGERAALADRISYVPWDRLSPAEQEARLRFRDARMSAAGREGADYQTRALWVAKLWLPPPTGPAGDEADDPPLGTGEALAVNVLGPATLTVWLVRPAAEGGGAGPAIEPLGSLVITSVGEAATPPGPWSVAPPPPGSVREHRLALPEGLHSLQLTNQGPPVRVIILPEAGASVQFGAEAAALPPGASLPLRPEVVLLPGYLVDGDATLDVRLEGPGDFLSRVVRVDARQIGDLSAPARLSVVASDATGRILASDEAVLTPVPAPFERLIVRRAGPGAAASPPVAEPLGFRFLAPVASERVRVRSDRPVFLRLYTLAASTTAGDLLAEPYRHLPLERTSWRYAPFEERAWVPLRAENAPALAIAGREARVAGQIRLEQRAAASGGGPSGARTVVPDGEPARRLVLERAAGGDRDGLWSALGTGPLLVRAAADVEPRLAVWVTGPPERHLGQRVAVTVDGQPAAEVVVRSARTQLRLPPLAAGEHRVEASGDLRGLRVLVDLPPAAPGADAFTLRTVHALGRLQLAVTKGAGPATLDAVIYAPGRDATGGEQLRVRIDGGAPRRLEGIIVERFTLADRLLPLPAADRPAALGFADGPGDALQPRLVAITLGDDLAPGTHIVEISRERGAPLWARFFVLGDDRRAAERGLRWRLAPGSEESDD